jgi:dolichol kinase
MNDRVSTISVARVLFHISGLVMPVSYLVAGRLVAVTLVSALLAALIIVEFLRVKGRVKMSFVTRQLKEKELSKPTGSAFYCVAALVTFLIFDEYPACAAMFVLALADPASSIVGRLYGKRKLLHGKTTKGTTAFFFTALITLMCFPFAPWTVLVGALTATVTELFSAKLIDDNLSIPLLTALALHLMVHLA